jgi:hypothetical protein
VSTISISPSISAATGTGLYWHECRGQAAVAYHLSYASKGRSGGSYGKYQNDCSANPDALEVLREILTAAQMPAEQIGRILYTLRSPAKANPLSTADLAGVNAAIGSPQGRLKVDALDAKTLAGVVAEMGRCVTAAAENGAVIQPGALMGMGMWINQSGPPSELLTWLRGGRVEFEGVAVPAVAHGSAVDDKAWLAYYAAIPFVRGFKEALPAMAAAMKVGFAALHGAPA